MTVIDPAAGYLGTLGRLVRVYSNPSMSYAPGVPERSFQTTLEGKVKAQVKPVGRRSWQLTGRMATGPELGALLGFATGEWGLGPFVWVPPVASRMNLLTPEVSTTGLLARVDSWAGAGGPLLLPDGSYAGRSIVNNALPATMYFGPPTVPVIAGQPVTGSAYVVGADAAVGVQFYNAAGAVILNAPSPALGVAGVATRITVTATPPATAVACRVYALKSTQAARPSLTWTDQIHEWAPGQGCPAAIVETVSITALKSSTRADSRRDSDMAFTIREVG